MFRASEVYGAVEHPAKEDHPVLPTSPYAASKAAFDMYLISVHKVLGFSQNRILALLSRLFNLFEAWEL